MVKRKMKGKNRKEIIMTHKIIFTWS